MSACIGPIDVPVARLASAPDSWHGYDFPILDDSDEATPTTIRCKAVAQLIGADYSVKVMRAANVAEAHLTGDTTIPVIGGANMIVTPMPALCSRDADGEFTCPNPELDAGVLSEYLARCAEDGVDPDAVPNAYWNLGKCGDSYTPIQNMDLCELLDTFLDACTEYALANPDSSLTLPQFETMGTLDNRRRFWAQVTLGSFGVALSATLTDEIRAYLLVTTSHDGRYAAQVSIVFVRVVCNNTLNMALDNEDRVFTIKHVGDVKMKVTNASRGIEWLVKTMHDEKARLESYVQTPLFDEDARLLCRAFFGFSSRQDWLSDRAIALYMNTEDEPELRGNDTAPPSTLYRLLQAITQVIEETQAGKNADDEAASTAAATARISGEYRGRDFTPTAANALCASVVANYEGVILAARKDADAEQQKRIAAELKRQEKAASAKESV